MPNISLKDGRYKDHQTDSWDNDEIIKLSICYNLDQSNDFDKTSFISMWCNKSEIDTDASITFKQYRHSVYDADSQELNYRRRQKHVGT